MRQDDLMENTISICEPMPNVGGLADEEIARVSTSLRRWVDIEHIGSTAVPGLDAKPIMDLMVGTPDSEVFAHVRERLTCELGYVEEGSLPYHAWLRWPGVGERTFHVHVVHLEGAIWNARIAFRDALRASEALRKRYIALKRELAQAYPTDLGAYTRGKRTFVDEVLISLGVETEPTPSGSAP